MEKFIDGKKVYKRFFNFVFKRRLGFASCVDIESVGQTSRFPDCQADAESPRIAAEENPL